MKGGMCCLSLPSYAFKEVCPVGQSKENDWIRQYSPSLVLLWFFSCFPFHLWSLFSGCLGSSCCLLLWIEKHGRDIWELPIKRSGFPGGLDGKESACNVGDPGLIPRVGRFPGEGNGNPFQYSCLENPTDRGDWQVTVRGVAKSQTQLSD